MGFLFSLLSCSACVAVFMNVLFFKACASQAIESCVITDSSCPCTVRPSSGTCMRYQGDGYCLMGNCNDGYKCDCLAYERCSISGCAKYTTLDGVIPSFENPFRCHLTPNAGNCTTFASFIDTIGATDYAVMEVSQTVATTNEDVIGALQDVMTIQGEKMKIDAALQELDQFANNVTEEERVAVEKEAALVMNLIGAAQHEAMVVQKHSMEASNAAAKSALYRRVAYEKEAEAATREAEEKVEAAKPENQPQCNRCVELKREVERLRNERREAAVLAGTWAKRAREEKDNGTSRRMNIESMKQDAADARGRAIGKVENILTRLRPSNNGTSGTGSGGSRGSGGDGSTGGSGGDGSTGGSGGDGSTGGSGGDGSTGGNGGDGSTGGNGGDGSTGGNGGDGSTGGSGGTGSTGGSGGDGSAGGIGSEGNTGNNGVGSGSN